jgi:hypothetical protein
MSELKTKVNEASVDAFLNSVSDEKKKRDSYAIIEMMQKITKHEPKMWGTSIIGFDSYHYKYGSGHEGDMCLVGFSPRKANITLYLMGGFHCRKDLMEKLGKHKVGKGCLYIKTMDDIDPEVLKEIIIASIKALNAHVEKWKAKNK